MDKNSSLYKTILLACVCAVAGVLLSAVNALTLPKINENAVAQVKSTLQEFYPDENDFTEVTDQYISKDESGLIDNIYQAGDKGYVFKVHNTGYDSGGFTFLIGFNKDGTVSGYEAMEQNETAGKGSKAFEDDYVNQIKSLKVGDDVPLISGATITSTAVKQGIEAAETMFNTINK